MFSSGMQFQNIPPWHALTIPRDGHDNKSTCFVPLQKMKLLECANECIDTNAQMMPYWTAACPELKLPMYVEVNDLRQNSVPDVKDNLINTEN